MKIRLLLTLSALLIPAAAALAADATVTLKDGSRVKGNVVQEQIGFVTLESSVGKLQIPLQKVSRIDYENRDVEVAAQPVAVAAPTPECRMGSNGVNACGYNCKMGSDGRFVCADTPDGKCAMGSNGRVTCSQLAGRGSFAADRPAPERKMNSDGTWTEGYNCRFGSNGQWYCASQPDGKCKFNSNGTFSCS